MNVINISHNIVIFSIITFFILIIIYNHCCSDYKEGLDTPTDYNINEEPIPVQRNVPPFGDMDKTVIVTNKHFGINPNESNYIDDATIEQMHTYPYCNKDGKGCEKCLLKDGGRRDLGKHRDKLNNGTITLKEFIKIRDKAYLCPKNKASKSKVKKVSKSKNRQQSKSIEKHKKTYMKQSNQFKIAEGRTKDTSRKGIHDFAKTPTSLAQ